MFFLFCVVVQISDPMGMNLRAGWLAG